MGFVPTFVFLTLTFVSGFSVFSTPVFPRNPDLLRFLRLYMVGLKIRWAQARASSTLAVGTTKKICCIIELFIFLSSPFLL